MAPFAGFEMPVQYSGVVAEHEAVRKAAGLFDVSHMGELVVRGSRALDFLQRMTPNDVAALRPGRAHYSALLTEEGTFIDDLLIYCRGSDEFLVVVNAANAEQDLDWLESHRQGDPGVEIDDLSESTALLALQGPLSEKILGPLTDVDLSVLRYYRVASGEVLGKAAEVSRTGYTGEDGFELYVDSADAADLWSELMVAGEKRGLLPAGLGARDTLRLEAGMLLSGQDIDDRTTPFEAGLSWIVKMNRSEFIGRSALEGSLSREPEHRLIGFELVERGIARRGHELTLANDAKTSAGAPVHGTVTSGSWSPTLGRAIGIARVSGPRLSAIEAGRPIQVEVRKRTIEGRIVELPFYRRSSK